MIPIHPLAVTPDKVETVTSALTDAGEDVFRIGKIVEGQRGCTVKGSAGTWSARQNWVADHDA